MRTQKLLRKCDFDIKITQGYTPKIQFADYFLIIDVIRAFTTLQVAFEKGLLSAVLVGSVEEAFKLKETFKSKKDKQDFLLAGEIEALKIKDFDFGNSPCEFLRSDLSTKNIIFKTTNGVAAVLNVLQKLDDTKKSKVLVLGLANADKTAQYILEDSKKSSQAKVHIIASHPTGDEDLACAEYIQSLLQGQPVQLNKVKERILKSKNAEKFLNPHQSQYDSRDIEICVSDRAGLVMHAIHENGLPVIKVFES